LARVPKVKFTKHAVEKFEVLKRYGFEIGVGRVMFVVLNPLVWREEMGSFLLLSCWIRSMR